MTKYIAIAAGLVLSGSALAGMTEWDITIQAGSNNPWSVSLWGGSVITTTTDADGDTVTRIEGSHTNANRTFGWIVEIEQLANRAGALFVSSNFTVSNNTGVLTPYNINVFLPGSLGGPTTMSGSISGSVGDGDGALDIFGNGATVRTQVAQPYYTALIDGVPVQTLYNAPSSNAAPQFGTSAIATQNFSGVAGPAVAALIGISNRFELTSNDNAQFTSTFLVVPTPGAVALFGIAGLAGVRRRR